MAKRYWLIKSEPSTYSWQQLVQDGRTLWEGVRNYEARNNLREMKRGDLALFYHTGAAKEIVGIAKVSRTAFQDPTTDEDWSVVEFAPSKALGRPVGLATVRAHKVLRNMALVKKGRISVVPVTPEEFAAVLGESGTRLSRT